jgi:hypothetical protein
MMTLIHTNRERILAAILVPLLVFSLAAPAAFAETPAGSGALPWPRQIASGSETLTVYSPQIEKWDGIQMEARAAVAVAHQASPQEDFGVIWLTAKTDVDRGSRIVALKDIQIARVSFPGTPEKADLYTQILKSKIPREILTLSLDRFQANLALTKAQSKPQAPQQVKNDPPRVFFSTRLAMLVLVDGDPVLRKIDGSDLLRVINTWALILFDSAAGRYYLRFLGKWMEGSAIEGHWTASTRPPASLEPVRQSLVQNQQVNMLDDPGQALKDAAAKGEFPELYVSTRPAELIQTEGQPSFAPIDGTGLLDISNTEANLVLDPTQGEYYALVSGRWFRTKNLMTGPWNYIPHDQLPADFAKIPENHPKGAVLASVAGTPQAREATIDNSIPQTAQVDRETANLTLDYDGQPQLKPIAGTPLKYVVNAPVPVIQVDNAAWYSLKDGVWFVSQASTGPWAVAASVAAVIYTIPPESPLHYVTYVYVYDATPETVVVGYTPGYYGTVVVLAGVVVYGTGYVYPPYVGAVWYPYPVTYGFGAGFAWGAATGFAFGFAAGAIWGGAWGHCCWGGGDITINKNININHTNVYNRWNHNQVVSNAHNRWNAATPEQRQQERDNVTQRRSGDQGPGKGTSDRAPRATGGEQGLSQRGQSLVQKEGDKRPDDVFAGKDGNAYRRGGDGGWDRSGSQGWSKGDLGNSDVARDLGQHQNARSMGEGREASFGRQGGLGGGRFGGGGFHGGGRR